MSRTTEKTSPTGGTGEASLLVMPVMFGEGQQKLAGGMLSDGHELGNGDDLRFGWDGDVEVDTE